MVYGGSFPHCLLNTSKGKSIQSKSKQSKLPSSVLGSSSTPSYDHGEQPMSRGNLARASRGCTGGVLTLACVREEESDIIYRGTSLSITGPHKLCFLRKSKTTRGPDTMLGPVMLPRSRDQTGVLGSGPASGNDPDSFLASTAVGLLSIPISESDGASLKSFARPALRRTATWPDGPLLPLRPARLGP